MTNQSKLTLDDFEDKHILYCYLDEAGDFNFSPSGSPYYIYTALVTDKPIGLSNDLLHAKYLLALNNLPFSKSHGSNDFFHATEDSPLTRNLAFNAICRHLSEFRIYSIVVQKNKANPTIRDQKRFFSMIMKNLIKDIILHERVLSEYDHLCIFTDTIPVQKKSNAIIGSIKTNLKEYLRGKAGYTLRPMESKSDFGLQAADYCSWAIYRAWTNDDHDRHDAIKRAIAQESDFFRSGKTTYY